MSFEYLLSATVHIHYIAGGIATPGRQLAGLWIESANSNAEGYTVYYM